MEKRKNDFKTRFTKFDIEELAPSFWIVFFMIMVAVVSEGNLSDFMRGMTIAFAIAYAILVGVSRNQ